MQNQVILLTSVTSPLTSPDTSLVQSDKQGLYIRTKICGKEIFRRLKSKQLPFAQREAEKIVEEWREKLRNLWLRDGTWYVVALVHGTRISRSLELPDNQLDAARRTAKQIIEKARGGQWEVLDDTNLKSGRATIGEVIEVFRREVDRHGLRKNTARDYISSLALVMDVDDLTHVSTERLTKDVVRKYVQRMLAAATADREASARRSICSTVRQARAMFGRWAMEAYQDAGLKFPKKLDEFVRCYVVEAERVRYRLPAAELIAATHKAALVLQKNKSDLWPVYLLTYYLALRAGEAIAAKWTWIVKDHDNRRWNPYRQSAR